MILGDHESYFDKVYNKDNCKLKTCSIVKDDNSVDSTNVANFEVVIEALKYTWKLIKKDIAGGITYPVYKMKCDVDINLGSVDQKV